MKIQDKLLELFETEDQWIQQITAMKDKYDLEELDRVLNPHYSISYNVNGKEISNIACNFDEFPAHIQSYIKSSHGIETVHVREASCWCLSGALAKINLTGDLEADTAFTDVKPFIRKFVEKYGEIDKFNDSHTYKEVIEAIKSIDA